MFSTIHYTSGGAAAGSLRQLCNGRPADCVVELLDPLAFGPLRDVDQPAGLQQRERYLRRLFERIRAVDRFDALAAGIGLPEFAAVRPDAARTLVWCGPNADEQLMLRAACARGQVRPLWVVDVGANGGGSGPRRAVGALPVDDLRAAEARARPLSEPERSALAAEWERLLRSEHRLRVFDGGRIIECEEDLFDPLLVAGCPREFTSAARVVGRVMRESPHSVWDSYLDYRLRTLIEHGQIEADDPALPLGRMQVRASVTHARLG